MNERFIDGLKHEVRIEVLKSQFNSFDECARIALNVDNAIWKTSNSELSGARHYEKSQSGPSPMEIGNVHLGRITKAQREQLKKDLEAEACVRCHEVGCRPHICRPKDDNVEVAEDAHVVDLSDSDLENKQVP